MNCKSALQTILDHVDYTTGVCQVNEMVGAVLPKEIIFLARQALASEINAPDIYYSLPPSDDEIHDAGFTLDEASWL